MVSIFAIFGLITILLMLKNPQRKKIFKEAERRLLQTRSEIMEERAEKGR